ncbi:MAG TPA: helix-turn-helix domain-containing protein [Candidatus Moranbacteria bacterium]|nr:helix-turn-helix domain-containing protein [Candidatus Moranbacteria bacterium]
MLNENQREKIKTALLKLNMTEKEVAIYISALQLGESSIPMLSKETGFSRGTIYDLVEKLKNSGFLAEIKKGKKRRIVPESPTNRLYKVLDSKHDQLKRMQQDVDEILPILRTINAKEDFKPQIRTYFGEKGFRQVWDEIFSYEGKNFLSIARIETFVAFGGENFLKEIIERKLKLGFISRAINENSSPAIKMQESDTKESRETRLAPKEFMFPSTEIIFGDKIAMFSTQKENIILLIESKDFADTHRAYFEMMWKFLEK